VGILAGSYCSTPIAQYVSITTWERNRRLLPQRAHHTHVLAWGRTCIGKGPGVAALAIWRGSRGGRCRALR